MEKRVRVPDNSMKLFDVIFELSGILYLYRDFVTVLAKITAAVTLIDKIKMELISSTTLVDRIKRNKSTKVVETNYWI